MTIMDYDVALIGFGEAGHTFALSAGWRDRATAYDRKTDDPSECASKRGDYASAGVIEARSAAEAAQSAALVLSLVTADEALEAARSAAQGLRANTLYCDGNSVAPETKRTAAKFIEGVGAHYVDMAILAPVNPLGLSVPIILSGPKSGDAASVLAGLGFDSTRIIGADVGRASAIKMIRSIMVKGVEALTAECVLAASCAGVLDEVLASLDASEKPQGWRERADYNLDRMLVHGLRRAAEMEEVAKTLEDLALRPSMTSGTILRQRELGQLGGIVPAGLDGKLRRIEDHFAKDRMSTA